MWYVPNLLGNQTQLKVPKDDSITMEVDYAINAASMINCLDKRSDCNAYGVAVAKDWAGQQGFADFLFLN